MTIRLSCHENILDSILNGFLDGSLLYQASLKDNGVHNLKCLADKLRSYVGFQSTV